MTLIFDTALKGTHWATVLGCYAFLAVCHKALLRVDVLALTPEL